MEVHGSSRLFLVLSICISAFTNAAHRRMLLTPMKILEPPYTHYLTACAGWLELGNTQEASAELDQLPPELSEHPAVLESRWQIEAFQGAWDQALRFATELTRVMPENPSGWLHRAYALRRCSSGGLKEAWEALLPAYKRFPKEATIPYNLSCYACQMNNLEEARRWFKRAAAVGGKKEMRRMALMDADLEPLWDELKGL